MKLVQHFLPVVVLSSVFALTAYSGFSQGICPLKTLRVDRVQGKVNVFGVGDAFPLKHTQIDLERLGNPDVLVKSTTTDQNGRFEILGINKGKYRLTIYFIVDKRKVGPKFEVILYVKKSNALQSNKYIFASLALDCAESTVTVQKNE